jgi:predicted RNA-binding Zn ribbon-like protein
LPSNGQHRLFELIAGHPALDLVNTLDWRFRDDAPEELLVTYTDLLDFAQQSGILSPTQARRLLRGGEESKTSMTLSAVRGLREAAAETFYAALDGRKPSASSIARLESQFKAARAHQKLSVNGTDARWEFLPAESSLELPLWRLSLSIQDLMTSEEAAMVRACAKPDCRWLFLDTSKNHSRRWCDMKVCGNRMKARRFKAQRREEQGI